MAFLLHKTINDIAHIVARIQILLNTLVVMMGYGLIHLCEVLKFNFIHILGLRREWNYM